MTENNRYKVVWTKPKSKNGFYSQQEVVVFGIDNVEHVIKTWSLKDKDGTFILRDSHGTGRAPLTGCLFYAIL